MRNFPHLGCYQKVVTLKKRMEMGKNTSISLGPHFEEFISNRLKSGNYKNVSEVVRAGLRLLEERENNIELVRQALQEGVDSGFVNNFDPDEFLKELKQSRREANG
jgi:antitoxin ParD1/3/4